MKDDFYVSKRQNGLTFEQVYFQHILIRCSFQNIFQNWRFNDSVRVLVIDLERGDLDLEALLADCGHFEEARKLRIQRVPN